MNTIAYFCEFLTFTIPISFHEGTLIIEPPNTENNQVFTHQIKIETENKNVTDGSSQIVTDGACEGKAHVLIIPT